MENKIKYDYTLAFLSEMFAKYAIEFQEREEKRIFLFKEDNPDTELPEHLTDSFNINLALSVMVHEIERLKNLIG